MTALLLVTGCATSDEPAPKETVYVQESPRIDAEEPNDLGGNTNTSREEIFVDVVRDHITAPDITDGELVDLGYEICSDLDNGTSIEAIATEAITSGVDGEVAGFLIGASVGAFCDQHSGKVEAFVDQFGGATGT